uniref:Cyclic nucleotide-gated ion channel 1-like n=1 Tax=Tanacetum cinerariifolium TaxID=118510 RepID=A0A6L2LZ91_TANCI|nr:cyclic nucleotide-gated ion channel 1-like [Tanacetum cinerariifolium]
MEEMKEKRREAEDLMSHISLPEELRQRVRRHKQLKWKITKGVELDSFVRDLPRDLRRDIKIREGDPVPEMLFITRGEVLSITTDGGRTGFFNSIDLKAGDFCGDEILTWALDSKRQRHPFSTRTVKAVTDVEAFALVADELLFVASQFRRLHNRLVQHTFRFYSQQWRTWAACYIQHAWRKHCKRKLGKLLEEENRRLQEALATGREVSTLSVGAAIYVSRFSSNTLYILRQKQMHYEQVSTPKFELSLTKPAQPYFDDGKFSP